jgi:VWFA-related protein
VQGLRAVATVIVATALAVVGRIDVPVAAQSSQPSLHITSPVGRTGIPATIRIVARLDDLKESSDGVRVEFYVDNLLLSTDTDGPPYEALWNDENPFERREILARAVLPSGAVIADKISLAPLTVSEAVDVSRIVVEASVLDDKGRFVGSLGEDDFEVLEDSAPQKLDQVWHRREPVTFTLLVDSSQSMSYRADALRAAAKQLLAALDKNDRIVVAPFSKHIVSVTGPTTDHATALQAISGIRPSGGTSILDVLQEAASALPTTAEGSDRHAIVLLTDGYDENSTSDLETTMDVLRKSHITLYAIGFGGIAGISLKGESVLSKLAEVTGGRAWFPRDDRRLVDAYEAAAADAQQKYVLSYTPSNQHRDGTWRTIAVHTRTPKLRVIARDGYQAPLAPPVRTSIEFTAIGTGETPPALTRDDIEVLEDGVPQKVDTFNEAVLPVTIMLALDASGSMKKSAQNAQEAAREFVTALRPEDEIGMIEFADKANYIHSPTERRDWTLQAIDEYKAEGGTALYDAVYDSLAQLAGVKGRRVVVVVTDGVDENAASNGPGSLRTWDDVLRQLQKTDAAIYAVGVGSRVERQRLQELADRSGGAAYFPADVTTLATNYHKILDELRRRYVVGYESTNRLRDGKWRKVQMRTRERGVTIRSRDGYYAPAE